MTIPPPPRGVQIASVRMSLHALDRQAEMGVSNEEIATCIAEPEVAYTQEHGRYRGEVRQAGRIAVVVDRDRCVTVLWRTTETYVRETA